ncbi:MAG: AraC family transcriptional regulator ligand-binding domain-containing protein [Devosia sp.]|nr:AraC family transcriptional regulator ligand-binding domain-containing protein [Devosia sp.]
MVQALGGDPEALLLEAGIKLTSLRNEETLVSWNRLSRAIELAASRLGRDTFGLEWAFNMPPPFAGAGPVMLIALQSQTVAEWIEKVFRYWSLHTNAHRLQLIENPLLFPHAHEGAPRAAVRRPAPDPQQKLVAIRFDCDPLVPPGRQIMEYMLGGAVDIIRAIAGPDDALLVAVRFQHMAPLDLRYHNEAFRCRLDFGADHHELVIDRRMLDLPIAIPRETLSTLFGGFLQYQKQRIQSYDQSITTTVGLAIPNLFGTGFCTLEFISEALGVSAKKLQRLLAQENTAFSEIYNRVRRDIACRILAETDVTFDRIAGLLDYASAVAFANAFRRWYGVSPRAFRKRAREAPSQAVTSSPVWWRAVNDPVHRELQRRR